MPYCVRCGTYSTKDMRDGVCSEDCWIELFLGNLYNYQTGTKVEES